MRRYLLIPSIIALCVVSGFLGYNMAVKEVKNYNVNNVSKEQYIEDSDDKTPVLAMPNKIEPSTKMVYQYYYADKGATKVLEDEPPYFMIGLTFNDMVKYYDKWDIVSFSPSEVVMKKTVYGDDEKKYIIGEKNGYIAVFFDENGLKGNIKEITSININGLSDYEKDKLKNGFSVSGDYSLNRVLESYSS